MSAHDIENAFGVVLQDILTRRFSLMGKEPQGHVSFDSLGHVALVLMQLSRERAQRRIAQSSGV